MRAVLGDKTGDRRALWCAQRSSWLLLFGPIRVERLLSLPAVVLLLGCGFMAWLLSAIQLRPSHCRLLIETLMSSFVSRLCLCAVVLTWGNVLLTHKLSQNSNGLTKIFL